jgi:tetratricopeptide (TPR) repeat protein
MPPIPSADVAHTAVTDHRLRRRSGAEAPAALQPTSKPAVPLIRFATKPSGASDDETARDQALALVQWAESRTPDRPSRARLARIALPPLEAAVQKAPADFAAWQARGRALRLLGRKEEALAAFEAVLAQAPADEEALISAAALLGQLGRRETAISYWKRALAVNPWYAPYHYELARLLVLRQDWEAAAAEGEVAVRLHPFHAEARQLLLLCHLQTGEREKARAEFETLRRVNPAAAEALRRDYGPRLR